MLSLHGEICHTPTCHITIPEGDARPAIRQAEFLLIANIHTAVSKLIDAYLRRSEYIIAIMQLNRIVQWQSNGDWGTIRHDQRVAQRIELAASKGGSRMP